MLLRFENIHKSFGEVEVLRGIDLELPAGSILGLIGENGAGKSTLMNLLGGLFPPSSGSIVLNNAAYTPTTPQDALDAGVAFIHQELNLFPNLTVTENLLLSSYPSRKLLGLRVLDRRRARELAFRYLEEVGLDVSPDLPVSRLTTAQRQLVEIAKALSADPRIIIFDEPTTSLTRHEVASLFVLIRELQAQGRAMIYISHNLEDVTALADRIAVLRDGRLVATESRDRGYTIPDLVSKMVGRSLDQFFPERQRNVGTQSLLRVADLSAGKRVRGVSFAVREREILGFYGLVGAGRSEIARLIYGLDDAETGRVSWRGEQLHKLSPREWIGRGVGFLTESRREEGLLLERGIVDNIQLAHLSDYSRGPFGRLDFSAASTDARAQATATRVRYHNESQPVATLSGGNQQKVVLGKWLLTEPDLLILDEPTKGIDIGAKHEIYRLINDLVTSGSSILLISSEIEELIGMCDRILVISEGSIRAEFDHQHFDRDALLAAALHG